MDAKQLISIAVALVLCDHQSSPVRGATPKAAKEEALASNRVFTERLLEEIGDNTPSRYTTNTPS